MNFLSDESEGWLVRPGPHGHGTCLVDYTNDGFVELLAPPGVPLEQPEPLSRLLSWRLARWADGELVGEPVAIGFANALELAPSLREWIVDYAEQREWRHAHAGRPDAESVEQVLSSRTAARDPRDELAVELALDRTGDGSTFSRYVARCDDRAPVKQVARLANTAGDLSQFRAGLAETAAASGPQAVRTGLIAVLHARARSHSWRCTKLLGPVHVEAELAEAQLAELISGEIDAAESGRELYARLDLLRAEWPHVDETLAAILFTRTQARRWQWTKKPRRFLAKPGWRPIRAFLRRCVRPVWAATKRQLPERARVTAVYERIAWSARCKT